MFHPEESFALTVPSNEDVTISTHCSHATKADLEEITNSKDSKWKKLIMNMLHVTLIFMNFPITNLCLLYAFTFCDGDAVKWHIVFCVLGYQLCMNQGTLMLSKHNIWIHIISDKRRSVIQFILQAVGCLLVSAGSIIIFLEKRVHFNTAHGIFGYSAFIAYLFGFLTAQVEIIKSFGCDYPCDSPCDCSDLKSKMYSITALLMYCVSLCLGFISAGFRAWVEYEELISLLIATVAVTLYIFVIEFVIPSEEKVIETVKSVKVNKEEKRV